MSYPYNIIIISLGVFLIAQGVFYAWQINRTPTEHGATWLSVVTGSLMIAGGATFALYIFLDWAGQIEELWPVLFIPGGVLILVGGSMAIGQLSKQRNATHKKQDIEKTGEFDLE